MKRISHLLLGTTGLLFTSALMAQTAVPEIAYDSAPNLLKLPEHIYLGEVPGVAIDSKGHVFVFTRSNSAGGPAFAPAKPRPTFCRSSVRRVKMRTFCNPPTFGFEPTVARAKSGIEKSAAT